MLDTNAFLYLLNDQDPYVEVVAPHFERALAGTSTILVSAVTEAELLVLPLREQDGKAIERIADLLSEKGINVIEISRAIARRAALLRANHKTLRLPDAMIIATALEAGCDLIVGNDQEWKQLKGLPYAHLDDIIAKATTRRTGRRRSDNG